MSNQPVTGVASSGKHTYAVGIYSQYLYILKLQSSMIDLDANVKTRYSYEHNELTTLT